MTMVGTPRCGVRRFLHFDLPEVSGRRSAPSLPNQFPNPLCSFVSVV
jgi:hypothetical protein